MATYKSHEFNNCMDRRHFLKAASVAAGVVVVGCSTTKDSEAFTNMTFVDESVDISIGIPSEVSATVNGKLPVSSDGDISGTVTIAFSDGTTGTFSFADDKAIVRAGGGVLEFSKTADTMIFNGDVIPVEDGINALAVEAREHMPPKRFSDLGLCMLTGLALTDTASWRENVAVAQLAASSPGFWCRLDASVGAGALLFLTALGCGALLAACGGATVITLGGVAFLCAPLIAACTAGSLASAAGCYDYIISIWSV